MPSGWKKRRGGRKTTRFGVWGIHGPWRTKTEPDQREAWKRPRDGGGRFSSGGSATVSGISSVTGDVDRLDELEAVRTAVAASADRLERMGRDLESERRLLESALVRASLRHPG